jgi:hypothetical protein
MTFNALKRLLPFLSLDKWIVVWYNLETPRAMGPEHPQSAGQNPDEASNAPQ